MDPCLPWLWKHRMKYSAPGESLPCIPLTAYVGMNSMFAFLIFFSNRHFSRSLLEPHSSLPWVGFCMWSVAKAQACQRISNAACWIHRNAANKHAKPGRRALQDRARTVFFWLSMMWWLGLLTLSGLSAHWILRLSLFIIVRETGFLFTDTPSFSGWDSGKDYISDLITNIYNNRGRVEKVPEVWKHFILLELLLIKKKKESVPWPATSLTIIQNLNGLKFEGEFIYKANCISS